jgi:hypothetical protein
MLKLKKLLAAAVILLLPATAAVFIASPAMASYSSCPASHICAYTDSNGNGSQWTLPWNGLDICQGVPGGWNDVISSAINQTPSYKVIFYSEANCWGGTITVWNGSTQNSFWPLNDTTSSWRMQLA